jgi:hypothetical protein
MQVRKDKYAIKKKISGTSQQDRDYVQCLGDLDKGHA